jgi:hypothetical protein
MADLRFNCGRHTIFNGRKLASINFQLTPVTVGIYFSAVGRESRATGPSGHPLSPAFRLVNSQATAKFPRGLDRRGEISDLCGCAHYRLIEARTLD